MGGKEVSQMSKAKVTTTVETEVVIAPKVQRKLLTELQGYQACQTEQKALKAAADEHRANIFEIADAEVEADKFKLEGFGVAVVRGAKDRRLDKAKLLKRLVADGKYSLKAAQALLEDCTTEKPKKDHVRVTVPGEESENEE